MRTGAAGGPSDLGTIAASLPPSVSTSAAEPAAERIAARLARVARPWRVVLILYALALEIGTHWPRLELGTDGFPISDKMIHTAAFAGGAVLLWLSGWIRRPRWIFLTVVAWAALDEITQGFPGLGRTSSAVDLLAGAIGAGLIAALLWAMAPIGRPDGPARLAHARAVWGIEESLGRWSAVGLVLLGALLVAPVGAMIGRWIFLLPRIERPAEGIVEGALLGAAAGAHMTMEVLRRRFLARAPHRCFACDAEAPASVEAVGRAACSGCGATLLAWQWKDPPTVRIVTGVQIVLAALSVATLMVFVTFGATLGVGTLAIKRQWTLIGDIGAAYRDLGYAMHLVIELFWVALVAAVGVRLMRWRLAKVLDHQHERCVSCRFDLRGTATSHGEGTCPECGGRFARMS